MAFLDTPYRRVMVGVVLVILCASKIPFLASIIVAVLMTPILEAVLGRPTDRH